MRANLWEDDDQHHVDRLSIEQQQELREQDSIKACFSLTGILSEQGVHLEATHISHIMWGIHRDVATLKQ